jgi:hypothetical protein
MTTMRLSLPVLVLLATVARHGAAQSRHGSRPVMPRGAEIALARSAAPEAISAGARVWIWSGSSYVVGDSGRTTVNCYVARPWVPSVEPHCMDEEASATILPVLMRKIELYAQGKTDAEVEREVADGIRTGRFRLPGRPALTYMMSAAQNLVSGDGSPVGAWQPHLMIYYPQWTGQQAGLSGFVADVGFIENPGTPLAALVVPLKTFVPAPR